MIAFWFCCTSRKVNALPPPGGWPDLESQWDLVPKSEHFHHKLITFSSQSKCSLLCLSISTCLLPRRLSTPPLSPHTSSFSCPGKNVWGSMFLLWSGRAELGSARLETALSGPPALFGYAEHQQLYKAIWHIVTNCPTSVTLLSTLKQDKPNQTFKSPVSFPPQSLLYLWCPTCWQTTFWLWNFWQKAQKKICPSPACYPSLLPGCFSLQESSSVVAGRANPTGAWQVNSKNPIIVSIQNSLHPREDTKKIIHHKRHCYFCLYPLHPFLLSHTVHLWEKHAGGSQPPRPLAALLSVRVVKAPESKCYDSAQLLFRRRLSLWQFAVTGQHFF